MQLYFFFLFFWKYECDPTLQGLNEEQLKMQLLLLPRVMGKKTSMYVYCRLRKMSCFNFNQYDFLDLWELLDADDTFILGKTDDEVEKY